MNIFSEFEGLVGENLSSAILHYLLLNSEEVRETFLTLLSDKSPRGVIEFYEHFSVRKEYPTKDEELGNGRLDLLIQVDNFMIGIENKFHAAFQDGQPEKYQQSLSQSAELLAQINKVNVQSLLYILCPEYKVPEANDKVRLSPGNMAVISWEEVLRRLEKIEHVLNSTADVVLTQFKKYLQEQFSFMPLYTKKYHHFRSSFPDYGTNLQHELIACIWGIFPDPYNSLSKGKLWIGYYFHSDPEDCNKGWFGFIPNGSIKTPTEHAAELVIATNYELKEQHEGLQEIELVDEHFLGHETKCFVYRVDFTEHWNTFSAWRQKLSSYTSAHNKVKSPR